LPQRVQVDLGIEGGGGQILMTKHLTDRDQPSAAAKQLSCQGMPQPVRSHTRKACPQAGPFHDVTDQVRTDRPARSPAGQEHPLRTCRRPAPGQVGGQGLANFGRQREPVLAACLPPDDELEVLRWLVAGRTKREIASELVISPSTVHTHTVHIYGKCGVSTRAGLAMFAMQHGLAAKTGPVAAAKIN
jgi:DNA-binding CsgD family transcriptional regulator